VPWLGVVLARSSRGVQRLLKRRGFDASDAYRVQAPALADVGVPAADRARPEQLCRYLLRPAVALDRLRLLFLQTQ